MGNVGSIWKPAMVGVDCIWASATCQQRSAPSYGKQDEDTSGFKSKSNALIWINMEKAMADGIKFYRSNNDVILSSGVIHPKYFIKITHR